MKHIDMKLLSLDAGNQAGKLHNVANMISTFLLVVLRCLYSVALLDRAPCCFVIMCEM